jgi:microcystin-dependent protein
MFVADPFLGQIMQVGFSYAPQDWAVCAGQILPVSQNQALFALLGTNFGGNGSQNFGLPDVRGRVMLGTGNGPGLQNYVVGEMDGVEQASLTTAQMPMHTHGATFTPSGGVSGTLSAKTGVPTGDLTNNPAAGSFLANTTDPIGGGDINIYAPATATGTPVNLGGLAVSGNFGGTVQVGVAGGSLPVSLMQPYVAVTTIIALQGIYPVRN